MSLGRSTPFKRMRSPPGRLSYDPMCTPSGDGFDDAALDNVRTQKRYLSEVRQGFSALVALLRPLHHYFPYRVQSTEFNTKLG